MEELRRFVTENKGTLITADVRTCMDGKISLVLNSFLQAGMHAEISSAWMSPLKKKDGNSFGC